MPNRAAFAYMRVSTTEQGSKGNGLAAQREAIGRFANAESFTIMDWVEEVETGKGTDALARRPKLAEVLRQARRLKSPVIVSKLDRLSRDVAFIAGLMAERVYKGELVWNATKKRDQWGQRRQRRRDESEWLRLPAEHLHIVSDALWQEVQDRWKNVRKLYLRATDGRLHGRPTNGHESPYLLTGFTACKTCTGSLCVQSESRRGRRVFYYACSTHLRRGTEACAEAMLSPMEALDQAILSSIEQGVLQPAIIGRAVEKAVQQLRPHGDDPTVRRQVLQKDLAKVEAALDRLAQAVAEGGKLSTLLEGIRKHEDQRLRLCTDLALLDSLTVTPFDPIAIEHELRDYLKEWPSLAQAHPTQTRQILRKLLPSRIRVWREVRGSEKVYHFEGEAAMGKLFNGFVNIERSGVPNGI